MFTSWLSSNEGTELQVSAFLQAVFIQGASGGTVGWGIALQAGRSRVRFPMVSLEFFPIDIILLDTHWLWGRPTEALTEMGIMIFLFCAMTNKCTTVSQIIMFQHVSTLSCRPRGACYQYICQVAQVFQMQLLAIHFIINIGFTRMQDLN
jgi:hypothetical protein